MNLKNDKVYTKAWFLNFPRGRTEGREEGHMEADSGQSAGAHLGAHAAQVGGRLLRARRVTVNCA